MSTPFDPRLAAKMTSRLPTKQGLAMRKDDAKGFPEWEKWRCFSVNFRDLDKQWVCPAQKNCPNMECIHKKTVPTVPVVEEDQNAKD